VDGIVRDLRAKAGATVAKDAVLAVVEPAPAPEAPASEDAASEDAEQEQP
jgi:pyruvate/2-oxoglutarate dehydrogenase complex dihydrolipoamide acyltransferase (E2) component